MDTLNNLQSLGLTLPTPAYLLGMLFFSCVGMFAWYRGKALGRPWTRWLGGALMFYPYAVSSTSMLYLIGVALCGVIWYLKR